MSDSEELRRLAAKLQPAHIRATLSFAGLYQVMQEMIRQSVVDQVRGFYLSGFDPSGLTYDEASYKTRVLDRYPKNRFRSSVLWLVDSAAITLAQGDVRCGREQCADRAAGRPTAARDGQRVVVIVRFPRNLTEKQTQQLSY